MAVHVVPPPPDMAVDAGMPTTSKQASHVHALTPAPPAVEYDHACQSDVPDSARIAAVTFEEASRSLYTLGATPEAIAYRAVAFDQHLRGALCHRQGRQSRPQGFYVARKRDKGPVIGFVTWSVQGGGSEQEVQYAASDDRQPDDYVALPAVANPPGFSVEAHESFVKSSKASQDAYMRGRERCYIKYLCVDPNVQRTGAGRALLHLVRKKNPGLPLYLEAATTPSAEQFYLKLGFQQLGTMTYEHAVKPLPCMCLEPDTRSILDDDAVVQAVRTMPAL